MITRAELQACLVGVLGTSPGVRALALGGSDATGRTDGWSDLDLSVVVEDEAIEATFERVEGALLRLSPIRARLRIPEPAWHGFSQEFFALEDAPETLMVDLALIPASLPAERRMLERERHGDYQVVLDPEGLFTARPLDRPALAERAAAHLASLRARSALFGHMPQKALFRGHLADAVTAYQGFVLRPLIDLLRLRHAPERYDFGARYLDRDLPAETGARLDRLCLPGDPEQLGLAIAEARGWLAEELAALDAGDWSVAL
ncbi:MAG: nucleotidyltransferase domain-containing protein [Planctomycetota bacterium]|nr:nucleotidyltransferase domain-containing protein [Planctomycetota bacterium]